MAKKRKKISKPRKKPAKKAARKAPRKAVVRHVTPSKPAVVVRKPMQGKPLTESEIQKFREILTQKREDLLAVVQRKKEQEIQIEDTEIGDEADIATRSVEKEMLFELTDSEKQTLDMIEAALRKMEKGVFGRCENCQTHIPHLRMEVMPWARYCIQCQAELETPSAD